MARYLNLDPLDLLLDEKNLLTRLQSEGQRYGPDKLNVLGEAFTEQIVRSARGLDQFIGDYIEYTIHPTETGCVLASFSRISNKNGVIIQKTLTPYHQGHSLRVVRHEAVWFEVGGLIHALSITNLAAVSGRFGLKIFTPTFADAPHYLRGTQLTTETAKSGSGGAVSIMLKRVTAGRALTAMRRNGGTFTMGHPRLPPVVAEAFSSVS